MNYDEMAKHLYVMQIVERADISRVANYIRMTFTSEIRKAVQFGMELDKAYFDRDDTLTFDQVADDYIKRIESAGGK